MAALKKIMFLQAALLVLAVLVVSAKADRLDFFKLLTSNNKKSVDGNKGPDIPACCDHCICTKSIPPQCRCSDIFISDKWCKNCEKCLCTRSFPPQCQCRDIKYYCDPPCSSSSSTAQIIKQVAA